MGRAHAGNSAQKVLLFVNPSSKWGKRQKQMRNVTPFIIQQVWLHSDEIYQACPFSRPLPALYCTDPFVVCSNFSLASYSKMTKSLKSSVNMKFINFINLTDANAKKCTVNTTEQCNPSVAITGQEQWLSKYILY